MIQENQSQNWCQFESSDSIGIVVQYCTIGAFLIQWVLLITSILAHIKNKSLPACKNVYRMMCLWLSCHLIKTIINIIAYNEFMVSDSIIAEDILHDWSSVFSFFDNLTTFCLLTVMIYIPTHWLANMLDLMEQVGYQLTRQDQKRLNWYYFARNFMKKYRWFRLIILLIIVINFGLNLFLELDRDYSFINQIYPAYAILQSIIIFFFYLIGFVFMRHFKDFIKVNVENSQQLVFEHVTLMLACITRMTVNGFTFFSGVFHTFYISNCLDSSSKDQQIINNVFNSLSLFLNHFVPGSMIFYIYWPVSAQLNLNKENDSLLDSNKKSLFDSNKKSLI